MPKNFYHISLKDLGPEITLNAKLPSRMFEDEPKTPRVCFAPTLRKCLFSIFLDEQSNSLKSLIEEIARHKRISRSTALENLSVYVPADAPKLIKAFPLVADFKLTGEHWSLTDISVVRLGFVDLDKLIQGVVVLTDQPNYSKSTHDKLKLLADVSCLSRKKLI